MVFKCVAVAGVVALATSEMGLSEAAVQGDDTCAPVVLAPEPVDDVDSGLKISRALQAEMARDSAAVYEVMIVLDVPKPDLSHIFGSGRSSSDSASAADRDAAMDAAEAAVAEILVQGEGEEVRRFRNAASILARVNRTTLEALAGSDWVLEIIENQRLKE